ncbi:MAG: NAD-dependent epimerase/dehydratase family protein [Anaerolineaceae bacterium]|nr:NAD-dependent epimerase/dehydratase family protein [Anaerolineaceae bacterium]
MRYLVTGATGFIGGHLCQKLQGLGEVRALHRKSSSLRHLEGLAVERFLGDISQPETLVEAMQDVDIVFHTAAPTGSLVDAGQIYTLTVEGTRAVLQTARESGVKRVVYTSSVSALGVPGVSLDRKSFPTPLNEYHTWNYQAENWPEGYAKYLAEFEVQKQIALGLDAVIVNPTLIFGRRDFYRQSSSLIVQIARGRIPFMVRGGINVVHIDDVIQGHLMAAEKGKCGERYILGGENLTHVQLIKEIAHAVHVDTPRGIAPTGLVRGLQRLIEPFSQFINLPVSKDILSLAGYYFYYDSRKAQVDLGLSPPFSASQAVEDAVKWFQENGVLMKSGLTE